MNDLVELKCVKEGSKLRVKIISPGYLSYANVQFPRDLRIDGRKFKVKSNYINLVTQKGRWFYSVKKRNEIEIVNGVTEEQIKNLHIYEDESDECSICMDNNKNTVFYPCGHYYVCTGCSKKITVCPYCKKSIEMKIDKSLID